MIATEPPTISIVIPAFNEERRLPRLIEALATSAKSTIAGSGFRFLEAVIVDDGSTDRTSELLREASAEHAFIRLVRGEHNKGKGAAIALGVRAARGDYSLLNDTDLSTPLSDFERLAEAMRAGTEIAIGSRVVAGSIVTSAPTHRRLLGRGFNLVVRMLTGLALSDTQCGFKLLPTAAARQLLAIQISPGWAYDVELLMRAQLAGLQIDEVPVSYEHDPNSRVRVASASIRMFLDVVILSVRLRGSRSGGRGCSGIAVRSAEADGPG